MPSLEHRLMEIDKQLHQIRMSVLHLEEQLTALRVQGHQLEGAKMVLEDLLAHADVAVTAS